MTWQSHWDDPLATFLHTFDSMIGDARTRTTFTETIKGLLGAGTLVCQQIAAQSPVLATVKNGAQRILRMVSGVSTKRSPHLDADHLTAHLREHAVAHLAAASSEEVWLIADGSELRKPYAQEMPHLMRVKALTGGLVNGYRTLTVIGLTRQRRSVLYHRLFSSRAPDFVSEPHEVQQALQTVSQALTPLKQQLEATWILDSGFDDIAVARTIWEQHEHVVWRVAHAERRISYQDQAGAWHDADLAQARRHVRRMGTAVTMLVVQRGKQRHPKAQRVGVELWACPVRLRYDTQVRRVGGGETVERAVWLLEVRIPDTMLDPWLLLTDWPVVDEASAVRIFCMYRQRWAVEDSFKFTKTCLDWETVQVLDLQAVRTLVALAWIAAAFLYELGVTLEWAQVSLLARLGGWVPHTGRKPGKITLTRGLRRLLEMLTTEAILTAYKKEAGAFPPAIMAFLHTWQPPDQL